MLKNITSNIYKADILDTKITCNAINNAIAVYLPSGKGNIQINKSDTSANAVTILGERNVPLINSTLQVETATVEGTITGVGNVAVVLTSAEIDSVTLNIPVLVDDTPTATALKIVNAMKNNEFIAHEKTGFYTASSIAGVITLTKVYATANDSTLNISIDNGTCTGITTAGTSANTTAGVAISVSKEASYKTYSNDGTGWLLVDTGGINESETLANKSLDSSTSYLKNVVLSYAASITRAEMVAGKTLIAAVTGRTIRILSVKLGVNGAFNGGAGTSFILQDTNGTPVVILTALKAALTTGAKISTEGLAIANVSEGAGMLALTASKGVVVAPDEAWNAGTNINVVINYMYI